MMATNIRANYEGLVSFNGWSDLIWTVSRAVHGARRRSGLRLWVSTDGRRRSSRA